MSAQRMTFLDARMVEVVTRIVAHPEALHHATRPRVAWRRERDDLRQPELAERGIQCRNRAFGRDPAVPVLERDAPTDLDARRECRLEGRYGEADETNEGGCARHL